MKHLIFILIIFLMFSCSSASSKLEQEFKQSIGTEFIIPNTIQYIVQGDTIAYDLNDYDYKILTFIDSIGCTSCKMRLTIWQHFLDWIQKSDTSNIGFCMFVDTDKESVNDLIKFNKFNYPVAINEIDKIRQQNKIPAIDNLRTFLLNRDNVVIAMGDPTRNPNLNRIYDEIINGKSEDRCDINVPSRTSNIGTLRPNEKKSTVFTIANDSRDTLYVDKIVTSCDCVSASLSITKIPPSCQTFLKVKVSGDSILGEYSREINMYFSNSDECLTFEIKTFGVPMGN